ncbi:MAG: glycosyltransferase family protein [Planctomycetota bacterium]
MTTEKPRSTGLNSDNQNLLRLIKTLALLLLIVLSLVMFMSSMAKPVVDAEHASCAAGVLLTQGKMIYRDFACAAQMPYHPFLCATIFKVFNTTHYLFAGRMLTVICDILILISIFGIFKRVFAPFPVAGLLLGMAMAVLWVFNYHVDRVNGYALNQDFVILCILVSFWLFLSIDFNRWSWYLRIGAMSVLLTLATCLHFTAILIQVLFFVMLLIRRSESGKQICKTALPFLIAPVIALILPIWTMFHAPRAFFINVFEMPMLKVQMVRNMQLMMGITVFDKFARILTYVTEPRGIFPFLVAICLVVLILLDRRKLELPNLRNAILAFLIPVIFLIIAILSPEVLYENFAMLIPFIIISLAYPLLYLRKLGMKSTYGPFRAASMVLIACAFTSVASNQLLLLRLTRISRPQIWIPMMVHQISEEVAQKSKEPKLVVTLAPLYALESGCDIYPELSTGWDGCKIASTMSASKRKITNTVDAEAFKDMLKETPPSAILIDRISRSSVGLVFLRIAKTEWPEQDYDESIWERKEYPFDIVAYFGL